MISKNKKRKSIEWLSILPIIALVFFLPFIIRLKFVDVDGVFYDYWTGATINSDFFTYYKKIFIYIITSWTLIHVFLFTNKIKNTKVYYFLGGFAFLVILSTVFSEYPEIALHGFIERHEGMWIILCYISIIFSVINLIDTKLQTKVILFSMGISGGIISLISIFQYFGYDIFGTEFAYKLMIPEGKRDFLQEFNILFGEKYSYGVFYNPNYLGSYMSFYGPLVLGLSLMFEKKYEKILFFIFFLLSTFALIFSNSEAGLVGYTLGIIVLISSIILKRIYNSTEKKSNFFRSTIIIVLLIIFVPISISYLPFDSPLKKVRVESGRLFSISEEIIDYRDVGPVKDIKNIDNGTIEIKIKESVFLVTERNGNLLLLENDKLLYNDAINKKVENHKVENQDGKRIFLTTYIPKNIEKTNLSGIEMYFLDYGLSTLYFKIEDGKITTTDYKFKEIEFEEAPYIGFRGKGSLGSGRGYIWSRSLPIALDNILIGVGQDTFITVFPHNDFYAKQSELGPTHGSIWGITDKPHNTYLQIAIQSGLISLFVFLIGILILLIKSLRKNFKIKNYILAPLSVSIIGWLGSSFFNDSIIAITPIIMVIIGILINENQDKGGKLDAK